MQDGTVMHGFCAVHDAAGSHMCATEDPWYKHNEDPDFTPQRLLVNKKGESIEASKIFGTQVVDLRGCCTDGPLKKKMSKGKAYHIFDAESRLITDALVCVKSYKRNGMRYYDMCDRYGECKTYRHNTDFGGTDLVHGTLGDTTWFLKAKVDNIDKCVYSDNSNAVTFDYSRCGKVGDDFSVDTWIRDKGFFKLAVHHSPDGTFNLTSATGGRSNSTERLDMIVGLARDLELPADTAEDIVKQASEKGKLEFWFEPCVKNAASVLQVIQEPNFEEGYDDAFGVATQNPQAFALATDYAVDEVPDPRIGDGLDPSYADGIPMQKLLTETPEALAQFAKMNKLPHMFEHGAVGSLVKTFDSIAMIDKYLPDLAKAEDALGRILFLFFWKPSDFQDAYGSDDMYNLEQELLSNFKQFGALLLNLKQKSDKHQQGSPALSTM
jgi:hypothetical protein